MSELVNRNHIVHAISGKDKDSKFVFNELKKIGVSYNSISLSRTGLNFVSDLKTIFSIAKVVNEIKPQIVIAYTLKPVVYAGIICRYYKIKFYYPMMTGLGYIFNSGSGFKRNLIRFVAEKLIKIGLKNCNKLIFQNVDNRNTFIKKGLIDYSKSRVVDGSGVDIKKFEMTEIPNIKVINFLCIARLLKEKGLREYADAAKIVSSKFSNAKFHLVGPYDSSPDRIQIDEVELWSDFLTYHGSSNDVQEHIKNCHIFVLPSYHEGIPRSSLEAMSMARPLITTKASGCKETVLENINGFKVSIGSSKELAEKMIWFLNNRNKIKLMGMESRKLVEKKFDVEIINKNLIEIMNL
ncbi:glycosyltransferase family 4 protein [Candidatus Pseudothioglobus singularis]|nr:glycosyltransferase family 4 protein [Candidatus Pseudothioglobus singularis]MDB4822120.1 glycosyltransferase family 4 protein [Candidatus Pseudothioglobus singularis]